MPKIAPDRKEEDKTPVPAWTEYKFLVKKKFDQLAMELHKQRKIERDAKKQTKLIDTELQMLFTGLPKEIKTVMVGDLRVTLAGGSSPSRVEASRLLSLGVDVDVITEATVPGKAYNYVKTSGPKENEDGDA